MRALRESATHSKNARKTRMRDLRSVFYALFRSTRGIVFVVAVSAAELAVLIFLDRPGSWIPLASGIVPILAFNWHATGAFTPFWEERRHHRAYMRVILIYFATFLMTIVLESGLLVLLALQSRPRRNPSIASLAVFLTGAFMSNVYVRTRFQRYAAAKLDVPAVGGATASPDSGRSMANEP